MTLLLQPLDILLPRQRRIRGVRVESNGSLGKDSFLAIMIPRLANRVTLPRILIISIRKIRNLQVLRQCKLVSDFEVQLLTYE